MEAQRPLIVPWLLEQLDAQRFPGVSWLDPERTRFRIPWKHGSRHSTIPEDFQLFEEWAIASGRFNPRTDPRTPSEWKRNFRSALNRKIEIKLIADNSTDSEDPHKVFQHLSGPDNHAQPVASEVNENPGLYEDSSPSCQDDSLEDVLKSLDLSSSEQVPAADTAASYACPPTCGLDQALPAVPLIPLKQIMESKEFETDFEVRIYYRGRLVFNDTFNNVRGLCFVPPGSPVPYPDLAAVVMPDTTTLNDQTQAMLTSRILPHLAPGVLLRIDGPSLWGSRLGRCHVFWSQSEMPTAEARCGGLPKEHFSRLYSLQQFVQELIGFLEGRNGSPDYTLWLCFGEDWPDPKCIWKKKLIMVQIIPKVFEMLHELSKANGASSLNGAEPDLRISDSLQDSALLEQLRDWEERMDVQFSS